MAFNPSTSLGLRPWAKSAMQLRPAGSLHQSKVAHAIGFPKRISRASALRMQQQSSTEAPVLEKSETGDDVGESFERSSSVDQGTLQRTRLILLMVAALYGTNFGSIKIMQEALDPSVAAILRFTLALAALSPFLKSVPKDMIKPGVEIGLWVAMGYVVQGIGLNTGADASTAAFLCSLAVVICPLLDLFAGETVKAKSWVAAALAVFGVGVLEIGGASQPSIGDLWALAQPIGFGMGFWKIEKVMRNFPGKGPQLTAIQLVVVWLTGLIWALVDNGGLPDMATVSQSLSQMPVAASVVWTGLITTALTVLLQTTSLGVLSSTETTVLYSTEPIWGAAFAHAVLGESIGMNTWVGGSLIISACLCSSVDTSSLKEKTKGFNDRLIQIIAGSMCALPGGAAAWAAIEKSFEDNVDNVM